MIDPEPSIDATISFPDNGHPPDVHRQFMTTRPPLDNSPVLALEHNITAAFESFRTDLRDLVQRGVLDREILLDVSAGPPRTPAVSRSPGAPAQIRVQVALLELLWAFVYSWMVRYEETVQAAQLRGNEVGSTTPENEHLVARAEELWAWARNLRCGYAPWPACIPSPRNQSSTSEAYYAGKANFVFERATSFMLLHECAHITHGHLDMPSRKTSDPLSVQLENEADQRAFDSLIGQGLADEDKAAQAWAILSAMLSSLFTLPDFRLALVPGSHPALHHRLGHLVRSLHFQGDRYRYYFHLLTRVVLQDAFPTLGRPGQLYEDAEDSLQAALDDLDALATSNSV